MRRAYEHDIFAPERTVASALFVKEHRNYTGVDACYLWGPREFVTRPSNLIALLQNSRVDLIARDYAAGYWDGTFE